MDGQVNGFLGQKKKRNIATTGGCSFAIKMSGRKWFKWFRDCECKCNLIKLNIYRLSLSKLQVN